MYLSNTTMAAVATFLLALKLVEIALLIWILVWSFRVKERCPCAVNGKLVFIQVYIIFSLASMFVPLLALFTAPMNLAFIVVSFIYLREMDKNACPCRNDMEKKALTGVVWLNVAQWIVAIVFILSAPLVLAKMAGKGGVPLALTSAARLSQR